MNRAVFEIEQLYLEASRRPRIIMVGGIPMITAFGLFTMGKTWHLARQSIQGWDNTGAYFGDLLNLVVFGLQETPLLASILKSVQIEQSRLREQGDTVLDKDARTLLLESLANWEGRVEAAMDDVVTLEVKSNFKASVLGSGTVAFFGEDKQFLGPEESNSFDEACRCLLTGSPTAAEFSALKVAESLLRRWYLAESGETLDQSWGVVLGELEKAFPDKKTRPKELAFLDYLNDRRIGVAHPIRSSVPSDAEFTVQAVVRLFRDLKGKLEPASPEEQGSNEQ